MTRLFASLSWTLLLCLTFVSLSACTRSSSGSFNVIGTAGGTARSLDGKVTLTIPAGALASLTTIRVTKVDNADLSPGLMAFAPDAAYEFEPDGLMFAVPATVTFDAGAPAAGPPGQFDITIPIAKSESAGVLEFLADSELQVTTTSQKYVAPISHFSTIGFKTDTAQDLGSIFVSYPLTLGPGEVQNVTLAFTSIGAQFSGWLTSFLGKVNSNLTGFSQNQPTTLFDLFCTGSPSGQVHIVAFYLIPGEVVPNDGRLVVDFSVPTTCTNSGIASNSYVALDTLGITKPEAAAPVKWCTQDELLIWIAAKNKAALISPSADLRELIATSGSTFDAVPLRSSDGIQLGLWLNGFNFGDMHTFSEADCTDDPGQLINNPHYDMSPLKGTALSTVGASVFPAIDVISLDNTGAPVIDTINTNSTFSTVISNPTKTYFLGATQNTRNLVMVDKKGTETFVAGLGSDPRRMRWDASLGIGGVSDFTDGTVTVFSWDGSATLPTVISTVNVGDGPVGIDVLGSRIVSAGFNDDTYSMIEVDPQQLSISSVTTTAIPFQSHKGATEPLMPGHAFFVGDTNNSIGITFFEADAMGFLPFQF